MFRKMLIPLVVGVVVAAGAAVARAWPREDEPASAPPRQTALGDIAGRGASLARRVSTTTSTSRWSWAPRWSISSATASSARRPSNMPP